MLDSLNFIWTCSLLQMEFGVGKVQMKFLHLLSTEASHSIILHCLNDPPYSTADSFSSTEFSTQEDTTLRFLGWNKQVFEKNTLLEPQVLQDECKVMRSESVNSVFSSIKQCINSAFCPLSDPRWQLAPVKFLLPYSGQSSVTYYRYTGISHITTWQSAAFRNRSSLLSLTSASPFITP